MTTSRETEGMDHPKIREILLAANSLTLQERLTLVKGLVPHIAQEMSAAEYEALVAELRLKGTRFFEAKTHPGEGRAQRQTPGERDIERR